MRAKICHINELSDSKPKKFEIKGFEDVAAVLKDGKITVFTNICPHLKISALSSGRLDGEVIYCPHHNQEYNIFTGERPSGGASIKVFEVEVIKDIVYIEIEEEKPKWADF